VKGPPASGAEAVRLIDERIASLDDWRGKTLAQVRTLIKAAVPEVVEEWKWGVPVWTHGGILCTGEVYKANVKLTFPKGSSLSDPKGLFNPKFMSGVRRSIDIGQGDQIDEAAFQALIQAAGALNATKRR
jgi:hypothetical protein